LTLSRGNNIWRWLVRALFGRPVMTPDDVPVVQMAVAVLALVGLLYLTMAVMRRWYWRAYAALALLLCAWSLEWFLVWDLREVQIYAIPAGAYLLFIGYWEWRQERKQLARWIDRAALLLLLGSVFYQSLAEVRGWPYTLLMVGEGLLLIWYGSARRQMRFLYVGVVGMVVAVVGQLIQEVWIALVVSGIIIMVLLVFLERKLEAAKRVFQDWQERLEGWE
jgi:hypothetical protein